jgi:hypothetical protein
VAINNNHCTSLHAHIRNEKKGFIKNKVMEAIITRNVEKLALIPFTHVYPLTFKSDGVWAYGVNAFPMLFTQ